MSTARKPRAKKVVVKLSEAEFFARGLHGVAEALGVVPVFGFDIDRDTRVYELEGTKKQMISLANALRVFAKGTGRPVYARVARKASKVR